MKLLKVYPLNMSFTSRKPFSLGNNAKATGILTYNVEKELQLQLTPDVSLSKDLARKEHHTPPSSWGVSY